MGCSASASVASQSPVPANAHVAAPTKKKLEPASRSVDLEETFDESHALNSVGYRITSQNTKECSLVSISRYKKSVAIQRPTDHPGLASPCGSPVSQSHVSMAKSQSHRGSASKSKSKMQPQAAEPSRHSPQR